MEYLLLRSFDNYVNAGVTIARLHEEGITCYLKDEFTVTIDPILSNAIGGIKLMVHQVDFDEAKKLLQQYDEVYRQALACPKCGSHDVQYISKPGIKNLLMAVFSWLFSSYAIAPDHVYHCYECSHDFSDLPEEEPIPQSA